MLPSLPLPHLCTTARRAAATSNRTLRLSSPLVASVGGAVAASLPPALALQLLLPLLADPPVVLPSMPAELAALVVLLAQAARSSPWLLPPPWLTPYCLLPH